MMRVTWVETLKWKRHPIFIVTDHSQKLSVNRVIHDDRKYAIKSGDMSAIYANHTSHFDLMYSQDQKFMDPTYAAKLF